MTKFILVGFMALASLLGANPASAVRPMFEEVTEAHKDRALVYVYRYSRAGRARATKILVNGAPKIRLKNRGYDYLFLEPGNYIFETKWARDVGMPKATLHKKLEANKTYYIRAWSSMEKQGVIVTGSPLVPVLPKTQFYSGLVTVERGEALNVITQCRLVKRLKLKK